MTTSSAVAASGFHSPDADVCHHLLVLHGLRVEHGVFDFAHYLSVHRHSAGVRLVDAVLSPLSPFFIFSELAFMFGTWGISAWDGRASYLSFFSMNLRALNTVLRGEQIKFHVTPKERQTGRFLYLVKPQIAIVVLTLAGLIWGGIQVARGQVDDPSGYVINIFWGGVNIAAMLPLIFAAMWTPAEEDEVTQ